MLERILRFFNSRMIPLDISDGTSGGMLAWFVRKFRMKLCLTKGGKDCQG
jgi:hypothetical protein